MKNVAVIAEYNPFHKGHAHQLKQLLEKEGAEAVLVVMSGDFVQRGEPAVADKAARTRMALAGGADMVVELPPAFATGSAEIFARGAVSLAAACGCIDTLAFGASCTDIARLKKAADSLRDEEKLRDGLREKLRAGFSYPAAAAAALEAVDSESAALLKDPNHILAAEYIRALEDSACGIRPLPLKREGSPHTAAALPEEGFASAGAIRAAIREGLPVKELSAFLPEISMEELDCPLFPDHFSAALSAGLLRLSEGGADAFLPFADSAPELAARLAELAPFDYTFGELVGRLKTRAFSEARVRRFLIHILLGIRKEDQQTLPQAIRILGLSRRSDLPAQLKRSASIPVIAKPADAAPGLMEPFVSARRLYCQTRYFADGRKLPDEYRLSPVVAE